MRRDVLGGGVGPPDEYDATRRTLRFQLVIESETTVSKYSTTTTTTCTDSVIRCRAGQDNIIMHKCKFGKWLE